MTAHHGSDLRAEIRALRDEMAALRGEVAVLRAEEIAALRARVDVVDNDHAHSRDERQSHKNNVMALADMMLALGERVGKVERGMTTLGQRAESQEELARLRHAEIMAMFQVAARDGTAKGERLATAETGLAKVAKAAGLSTTVIAVVGLLLNFLSQHLWRLDRHGQRTSETGRVVSGQPATLDGPGAVRRGAGGGADVPGAAHPDP